jgi:protein SCO1/2
MGPKNFITAIILGVALAAGFFVAKNLNQPAKLQAAFEIPIVIELPEFTLMDQMGNTVDRNTFRGQWDLVFFGFTHCPDVCPTTLQLLSNVKRELTESGARTVPRVVLVSVDPERDTPELLGQYVDYFGEGNLAVTGELAEVRKLTKKLGIFFEKTPADGENYGVDHAAAVIVLNDSGEFSALFNSPHSIANFVHDLPILTGDD